MRMLTIAICDENTERREQLKQMIQKHPENEELSVKTFCSEEEILANDWVAGNGYDLVVLGIQPNYLDERKAEELLQKLGEDARMAFLYISDCTNHAIQIFTVRPLNFLAESVTPEKFVKKISDALALASAEPRFYTYSFRKTKYVIPYDEILYFENRSKKVLIHCLNRTQEYYGSFRETVSSIKNPYFVRIHCSFLVNWNHVSMVSSGCITLDNHVELAISRNYRKNVREFCKSIMEQGKQPEKST